MGELSDNAFSMLQETKTRLESLTRRASNHRHETVPVAKVFLEDCQNRLEKLDVLVMKSEQIHIDLEFFSVSLYQAQLNLSYAQGLSERNEWTWYMHAIG